MVKDIFDKKQLRFTAAGLHSGNQAAAVFASIHKIPPYTIPEPKAMHGIMRRCEIIFCK